MSEQRCGTCKYYSPGTLRCLNPAASDGDKQGFKYAKTPACDKYRGKKITLPSDYFTNEQEEMIFQNAVAHGIRFQEFQMPNMPHDMAITRAFIAGAMWIMLLMPDKEDFPTFVEGLDMSMLLKGIEIATKRGEKE